MLSTAYSVYLKTVPHLILVLSKIIAAYTQGKFGLHSIHSDIKAM